MTCECCSRVLKTNGVEHSLDVERHLFDLANKRASLKLGFPRPCDFIEAFLALVEHWTPTTCKKPATHAPGCDCGAFT